MEEYEIIEEPEIEKLLTIPLAISVLKRCFSEKSQGTFRSLPKYDINGKHGSLRITPGESISEFGSIGFRLYDVIRKDFSSQPQVIVVYDNQSGYLKGILISQLLGAFRTAATNAVMQSYFHEEGIEKLGVIGTGYQSMIHTQMFEHLLRPSVIKIYGRTRSNRDEFIETLKSSLSKKVELEAVEKISDLKNVESLLLATRSQESLLEPELFNKPMVITTIGPKAKGRSELSDDFSKSCDLIVTDSIEQVHKYGERFFVSDLSRIKDFSDLLKSSEKPITKDSKILLCSVGMGGTEVALASELIKKKKSEC